MKSLDASSEALHNSGKGHETTKEYMIYCISEFIFDISTKYEVKNSTGTIYGVLEVKERILENMKDATISFRLRVLYKISLNNILMKSLLNNFKF